MQTHADMTPAERATLASWLPALRVAEEIALRNLARARVAGTAPDIARAARRYAEARTAREDGQIAAAACVR